MNLFDKKEINKLQNEVEYLQFVVDIGQSHFEKIEGITEELTNYLSELENGDIHHYVQLMEMKIIQLQLQLNNQKLERMNAKYARGEK